MAAGVFAPSHMGELTWVIPFELADAVREQTRTRERRLRALPSRVGVYFVLAMCLFPGAGYRGVWARLTAGLDARSPDGKALRDLRRRLGAAPLRALFDLLAGPVAWPRMPGECFGRYWTVAFDGCRSIRVLDTARNRAWLGKLRASLGETGYPVIQLMTLCETGSRALIGAVFGTPAGGELAWARRLLGLLDETMLVLMDRGFDVGTFLAEVAATRAQFLVRLTAARRPPPAGTAAPARRVVHLADRRGKGAHHRGQRDGHLPRRHHLRWQLPAGDHAPGSPRQPRRRADRPVPRAVGARDRMPRAAAHGPGRPGAALG